MNQQNNQASFARILEALSDIQAGKEVKPTGPEDDLHLRQVIDAIEQVARLLKAETLAQHQNFDTLLASTPDALVMLDAEGRYIYVNRSAEEALGLPLEELLGKTPSQLNVFPKESLEQLDRSLATVRETRSSVKNEGTVVTPLGSRYFEYHLCPILGDSGALTGFTVSNRDVTDRVAAEHDLQSSLSLLDQERKLREQSSQYTRSLIEASLDPLVTISSEGKITDVNEGSIKVTGVARELLIGTDFSRYFTEPAKAQQGYKQVFEKGFVADYPLTIKHKDGRLTDVLYNASVYKDGQGNVLGVFAAARDVTHQKQASQYARSLLEASLDPLVTISSDGKITDVNEAAAKVTGVAREKLVGTDFSEYFTEPEQARAGYRQVFAEGFVTDYPLTIRHKDGRLTDVLYNASVYRDVQGNVLGVFAAARDVTAHKRVEKQLKLATAAAESASRIKSDFLASMSHEIRTPMNAIMGIADLLAKTPLSTEQDKYVQIFRRAGDNLLNLVNDILDLSKVEASQLELERTGFALNDLLEKVTEMVAPRAEEKSLTLVCEIAPDVPVDLIGDPTRVRQVLLNLVGNAIKFTASGEVSLRVAHDGDSCVPPALRFTISDTGIGIADEKLARVFEPFTQADSSTTRRFGGSGLGLTISKRLVEAMGGRIWVNSEVGRGSVFCCTVPFEIPAEATQRTPEPVSAGSEPPLPALRILLAEDSPDNCTITLAYLEDTPYRVDIAESGAIACEMFAASHYDLVLMDRQMPVMDGLTATRTIRAWEAANGRTPTPIIALTASALKGDREKCLAAGCTGFLTKPIKQEVLLQAIHDRSKVASTNLSKDERIRNPMSLVLAYPKLAARIPAFLENRRQDVITMLEALGLGDFETVARLGHSMKGSGASFGFQAISDIGAALEQKATEANTDASRRVILRGRLSELSTYLEGVGSGVEFTLPPPLSDTRDVTADARPQVASSVVGARRIVVVDDSDDMREVFREVLEHLGHQVTDAQDGIKGLALILAERPDVAIIDISMDGMDGYDVARGVRAALGNSLLLVALSGHDRESDRLEALAAGFDTHLSKPVDMVMVQQLLRTKLPITIPVSGG